jgi:hypothetical protein
MNEFHQVRSARVKDWISYVAWVENKNAFLVERVDFRHNATDIIRNVGGEYRGDESHVLQQPQPVEASFHSIHVERGSPGGSFNFRRHEPREL